MDPVTPLPAAPSTTTAGPGTTYFLCGAVRSGTTLLRLLLGHHPQLTRCEEFDYVAPALHEAGQTWPNVARYRAELPHRLDVRVAELPRLPEADEFAELARALLELHARADGRRIVGAAVHEHFDQLVRVWPRARFIFLRRDPRDVARSCVEMGFVGNAWAGAAYWQHAETAWARLKNSIPASQRMELRFEDLIQNAKSELDRICAFLGVPYVPQMLEIERDTTYKRPDPRSCRSWRDDAKPSEIAEVEGRLGDLITAAGYALSGQPRWRPGPLQHLVLRFRDRWGRIRFSWRRYGVPLWFAGVVTRRLPIVSWRRSVQARIDSVRQKHFR
jgi:hypothetical protein